MNTDSWSPHTIDFLKPYFRKAQHEVRIATGYFTVRGYDLIRHLLDAKRVCILAGYMMLLRRSLDTAAKGFRSSRS